MRYLVLFTDNEDAVDQRQRHMQAHLAFLAERAEMIEAAGPVVDTASDQAAGGVWLVEAPSVAVVDELVREDPFWPTGLRQNYRILAWKEVFRAGDRLI